jgi:uncharacterized protein (TIGR02145 family)
MTIPNESNTFEIFLNSLVQDFGGLEIFDEENESRLNKATKSLADSFSQEKKWMQIACMENIPQKLYSVIEFPQEAQQRMIDNCLKELSSFGLTSQVVEDVVAGFISILKLKGSTKKEPEIKKVLGEAEIVGDTYKTCKIGNQIWMAENFRLATLPPGYFGAYESIGLAVPGNKYGRLYTHRDAQISLNNGWRLPTMEDWLKMVSYIESLGFDVGTALKSKGDWSGDADPGLDLFGFAAHPIKYWDDNLPQKQKIKRYSKNSFSFSFFADQLNRDADRIKIGNQNIEDSVISNFPCVQFWMNTNYVDDPCVDYADDMAYVATLDSSKNTLDLDKGKLSSAGRTYSTPPFGFACVRYVRDVE